MMNNEYMTDNRPHLVSEDIPIGLGFRVRVSSIDYSTKHGTIAETCVFMWRGNEEYSVVVGPYDMHDEVLEDVTRRGFGSDAVTWITTNNKEQSND